MNSLLHIYGAWITKDPFGVQDVSSDLYLAYVLTMYKFGLNILAEKI